MNELTKEGVDASNVRLLRPSERDPDSLSELRAEMRDEVAEGFAAPGVAFMTPRQARGASRGLILGGVLGPIVGLAVGVGWAIGFDASLSPVARLLIAAVPFALGGSIAGAVAGGALQPRSEAEHRPHRNFDDERLAAARDTVLAVHVANKLTAERAWRVLSASGAERVDAVNADGTPLPPQSEHLRPADPAERWWEPGQSGG
jgi:hypothetical protein